MKSGPQTGSDVRHGSKNTLLPPQRAGRVPLEECLLKRRSIREYTDSPLTVADVAQLVWAAQGVTSEDQRRTAPSAGALYPMETYLVALNVEGLASGLYKYHPEEHSLALIAPGSLGRAVARAALDQDFIQHAGAVILMAAVNQRTTVKYGQRGIRYVHMEAGHTAQNVCLQATALGLGCVPVGAFDDSGLRQLLQLDADEEPLYLLPSGEPEEAAWISTVTGTRRSVATAAHGCRWYSELGNRKTRR